MENGTNPEELYGINQMHYDEPEEVEYTLTDFANDLKELKTVYQITSAAGDYETAEEVRQEAMRLQRWFRGLS